MAERPSLARHMLHQRPPTPCPRHSGATSTEASQGERSMRCGRSSVSSVAVPTGEPSLSATKVQGAAGPVAARSQASVAGNVQPSPSHHCRCSQEATSAACGVSARDLILMHTRLPEPPARVMPGGSRLCDPGIRPGRPPFGPIMMRRSGTAARIGPRSPARWRYLASLLCALALTACGAVEIADRNLRRIDILDRVFEPERFRPPPEPLPQVQAEPLTPSAIDETGSDAAPQPAEERPPTLARAPEPAAAPAPEPVPGAVPAQARQPDPAVRRASLLRQFPWLAQFWGELEPAQQGRVSRALRRAGATPPEEDPARWDRMGLADRVRLVFG